MAWEWQGGAYAQFCQTNKYRQCNPEKSLLGNPIDGVFDPSRSEQPARGNEKTFVKPLIARVTGIECDGKPHATRAKTPDRDCAAQRARAGRRAPQTNEIIAFRGRGNRTVRPPAARTAKYGNFAYAKRPSNIDGWLAPPICHDTTRCANSLSKSAGGGPVPG
jgi:hypothetical protein